jgi:alcohol dehydrogenase class IV
MLLPHVLEYNVPDAATDYAELAPLAFAELAGLDDTARIEGMIEAFKQLGPELGMKSKLSQVGVNHNHLPMLAEDAMKQTRLLVNNPREMTLDAARAIYEKAL